VEIGGTIGDYQNIMFIEAARVLKLQHPHDVIFVLVSYLPIPNKIGEMKTRPTQNAVRQLNSYGIQPDIIIARSEVPLDKKRKEKLSISCNVLEDHVISAPDIESIYDVPLNFEKDSIGEIVLATLNLKPKAKAPGISLWRNFVGKMRSARATVRIAIVGKYFDTGDFVLGDAYVSVIEAIKFSAYNLRLKPEITWLNAKDFEPEPKEQNKQKNKKSSTSKSISVLKNFDGVIVPGGFGESGIEGKIKVIQYCRENKIPYFGLCYGMQLMVIEYARNVLKLAGAHTAEIDPNSPHKVIDIMPDQKKKLENKDYGGSMRLGAYPARLRAGTLARKAYGTEMIFERHRHRYEVNPEYVDKIFEAGLIFSGTSPDGHLMEIAELRPKVHPFFLGTQFHPEFLARPLHPHPLFTAFIKASRVRRS